MSNPLRRIASFLILTVFFANPLFAQRSSSNQTQGKPPAPVTGQPPAAPARPQPAPQTRRTATLETLFAADSYKLYGEVRAVGQLVTSPGVVELLEPIMKLSTPPEELKALIKFLNTNAEPLAGSPMMFAAWPARSGLPQAIVAIELPSVEEAEKFEPKLKTFLPVIIPAPTPRPTPELLRAPPLKSEKEDKVNTPEAAPAPSPNRPAPPLASGESKPASGNGKEEPAPPPFHIKRSGALIIITDSPFTFKNLRPVGSKLLTEDQNFRVARDRFSSEPLFVYYNVALEDESARRLKEMASSDRPTILSERPITEEPAELGSESKKPEGPPGTPPGDQEPSPDTPPENPEPEMPLPEEPANAQLVAGEKKPEVQPDATDPFLSSLFGSFGFGAPEWPDAVGVALAFESDSYIIRVILIDPPTSKVTPIPFLPQLISGRAGAPEAPSVLPADTEVFASASLDLRRMYEALLQNLQKRNPVQAVFAQPPPGEEPAVSPAETAAMEAVFEKKYGFKIKEELLPALGNEFAIGGSMKSLGLATEFGMAPPPQPATPSGPAGSGQLSSPGASAQPAKSSPIILLSVKDRDAVKALIPKLLDALGMKALSMIAQTEKRGDTETVTYAGLVSYAFVGNFLVLSPEVAEVRHVVDSYVNHETLGSNSSFRTFTRWQPRDVQGVAYMAPSVMAAYYDLARSPKMPIDAPMRDFIARLNPTPAAISYALSNDGFGPMHELHLPKNWVLMMVAGVSAGSNQSPLDMNESVAKSALRTLVSAEETYKATSGNGSYGTMEQLATTGLIPRDLFEKYGYKFDVTISGTKFEATATPKEYGVTGRLSFFVDETGVIREADHNGAPANASDPTFTAPGLEP